MNKEDGKESEEHTMNLKAALKSYKEMMKCKLCETRNKNVLLVKCGHLFCRDCIMKNIQMRERHCPVCRRIFTSEDIKPIWWNT